jgi:hypothetical protein
MLDAWNDFFTLTGSAGATLLGLLFVVVTLGPNLSVSRKLDVTHAVLTPALYSFAGVLAQSMVALTPWTSNLPSGIIFVLLGVVGLIYRIKAVISRRSLNLRAIQRTIDRIFHNLVPIVASLTLIAGGAGVIVGAAFAPYAIAGSSALLLFSGIYRTWGETVALIGTDAVS